MTTPDPTHLQSLVGLCANTHTILQTQAVKAVDTSLVIRNWLFGYYIVEFENGRSARSELYGKQLLTQLSNQLKGAGLQGFSATRLRLCRLFYEAYSKIHQAVPDESLGFAIPTLHAF